MEFPELEAFWTAASEGRLLLPHCPSCGRTHWYPRAICPHCLGDCRQWTEASGAGVIYSWSVMRRLPAPIAIAYVTLAEGPVMLTNIIGCDFDALAIGQNVKLAWQPRDNAPPLPCFTPA